MKTVLMAIAIVKQETKVLLRKTDPERNPYSEPWALFGGRIEGEGTIQELLNKELSERWNFSIEIDERLWWDEDIKADHDGEVKRFVYIDTICSISNGVPNPINKNEELEWAEIEDLSNYNHNPPGRKLLKRLGYIES